MQVENKTKTADSAAALRAELEIELKNKKQCAYQPYQCTQLTVDGYKYCLKHILQDKNAPYKQCNFIYSFNGKRCHLPAPKSDKKDFGYCNEHALKTTLTRNRQNCRHPLPHTPEVILNNLTHYIRKPRHRNSSSTSTQQSDDGDKASVQETSELKTTKSLDPFVDIDANSLLNTSCNNVLDVCSESESDIEPSTVSNVWPDANLDSSDNESIDSEQEDVLKHANVYTAEEITLITRDKLLRLQSLYIEQYRHLQYILREKRRKYLHSLKREKETCCNIYSQVRDTPKEQKLYQKLKLYNRYQKTYGTEAILIKRHHDLRAKLNEGVQPKSSAFIKCIFSEGGVKCGERVLPMSKHCRKHILEDPNQVLFKSCGKIKADVECNTPVEAIFDNVACKLHAEIPALRSYNHTRKDSESDIEDSPEPPTLFPDTPNVKTELLDYDLPKMDTVPQLLFEDQSLDEMDVNSSIKSEYESMTSMDQTESNLTSDCFGTDGQKMDVDSQDGMSFNENTCSSSQEKEPENAFSTNVVNNLTEECVKNES